MSDELEPSSSVVFTRIKSGIMIEVEGPEIEEPIPPFGISFNIDPDLRAWHCLLEWFVVDEENLKWNGDTLSRKTNLNFAELIDLIASSWMIEDLMMETGEYANYINTLMIKFKMSKSVIT